MFPQQTGFSTNLYSLRGFPEELAAQVEQHFLQPVDTNASTVLKKLMLGFKKHELSDTEVLSWSKFLLSLLLRMPEDIEGLRRRWSLQLEDISESFMLGSKRCSISTEHDLFSFTIANPPVDEFDEDVFNVFLSISTSQKAISLISNMHWGVVKFAPSRFSLCLSDRPIVRLSALGATNGALILPISNDSLFIAANRLSDLEMYRSLKLQSNLREANQLVVSQAYKYAYAPQDDCLRFMQNHLSTIRDRRAIDGMQE